VGARSSAPAFKGAGQLTPSSVPAASRATTRPGRSRNREPIALAACGINAALVEVSTSTVSDPLGRAAGAILTACCAHARGGFALTQLRRPPPQHWLLAIRQCRGGAPWPWPGSQFAGAAAARTKLASILDVGAVPLQGRNIALPGDEQKIRLAAPESRQAGSFQEQRRRNNLHSRRWGPSFEARPNPPLLALTLRLN
jgi:hypothetical protein